MLFARSLLRPSLTAPIVAGVVLRRGFVAPSLHAEINIINGL